jgi:hypothetical protein
LSATEELDPTFDGDGKVLFPRDHEAVYAEAVVVQPGDQKILVAGSAFADGDWDFALVRYYPACSATYGRHVADGAGEGMNTRELGRK